MKKILQKFKVSALLFLLAVLFNQHVAQTTNPPPVLHREITWADKAPNSPAVFGNNAFFMDWVLSWDQLEI